MRFILKLEVLDVYVAMGRLELPTFPLYKRDALTNRSTSTLWGRKKIYPISANLKHSFSFALILVASSNAFYFKIRKCWMYV
jgi:hypothetical protein